MKARLMVRVAVFLLLEKDGRIFCIRRANTGFADGMYTLPSGHVDPGETPLTAVIREAKEEAGVEVREDELTHVHTGYTDRAEMQYVNMYFLAKSWTGTPCNAEPEKCDAAEWYSYAELPEPMLPYVAYNIELIQKNISYSDFWIEEGTV